MATTTLFSYSALPDNRKFFRLLELLPGSGSEPLQCRLRTERFIQPPPYEALSYVWRTFYDDRDFVQIQLLDGPGRLAITWNLQAALQCLRDADTTRRVWADAICINQSNSVERKDQVQCMRKVYANASRVLAWLGNVEFDAAQIFGFLNQVAAVCPEPRGYGSTEYDFKRLDTLLASADKNNWNILKQLHRTALFNRLWVVQELNLANDGFLFAGSDRIRLSKFKIAVFWLNKRRPVKLERFQIPWSLLDPYLYLRFNRYDPAGPGITDSDKPQPIHYVLRSVRNCKCTDPRDKIYALLGHSSLEPWVEDFDAIGRTPVPVDYDIPYTEVYIAVAKRLLEE